MMLVMPGRLRDHIDRFHYSLLRASVEWLVPAAVQFDEGDPILGAGFAPELRRR